MYAFEDEKDLVGTIMRFTSMNLSNQGTLIILLSIRNSLRYLPTSKKFGESGVPSEISKRALLLISLGTPDSPNFFDVGKYLSEFLMDSRMIRVPWLLRFILVNLIIVPTRSFSSSKAYKELLVCF